MSITIETDWIGRPAPQIIPGLYSLGYKIILSGTWTPGWMPLLPFGRIFTRDSPGDKLFGQIGLYAPHQACITRACLVLGIIALIDLIFSILTAAAFEREKLILVYGYGGAACWSFMFAGLRVFRRHAIERDARAIWHNRDCEVDSQDSI